MKIIITGPDEEARENFEADEPVYVVMVDGDLSQFTSAPNVGREVQDIIDRDRQVRVGSRVRLGASEAHGEVVAYDRASKRYFVKWASGYEGWYPEEDLEVI